MLEAKRKRLSEEQESMDMDADPVVVRAQHPSSPTFLTLSEGMNCSSQSAPHPTKRACAGNARILKDPDHIPGNACIPAEVLDLVKSPPPARYVDFGGADLMINNGTVGFGQEVQDNKEVARRDDRDKGDGFTEEANEGLQNDDEVNGQAKNNTSHSEFRKQKIITKSFDERIEELEAFKEKHGHVRVTLKQDKSLHWFCTTMRSARRTGTKTVASDYRIKALEKLGFDWEVKNMNNNPFEKRIEELAAFKEKHGHVRVTVKQDKSLGKFCENMRTARRGTGKRRGITEDRIKALDQLGFDWGKNTKAKSFKERIEELKAFEEKHGHVRVTVKHDKSLATFCNNMRSDRRGTGATMAITEDRIKALDELGFDWGVKQKSFEERIEDLKAFKAKHGHVRVTMNQDKSLANFCSTMRSARRGTAKGTVIAEDRIKALDELGFKWAI